MARRIKEEPGVHRNRIAAAAGMLFESKGIEATTMSEVAKEAGYSKATLYVYFKNKEEIVAYLVLCSMTKLKEYLSEAIASQKSYQEKYLDICWAMVCYQEEYPFYFSMALEEINIDFAHSDCEESERETFQVGEDINQMLVDFFARGVEAGAFRKQADHKAVIFSIWGMLSGVIQLASNKQEYISQEIHLTKTEFLERGFLLLWESLRAI